jgi:Fe-S-cluster containining protein
VECQKCGNCCKYALFTVSKETYESLKDWNKHHNIEAIPVNEHIVSLLVPCICTKLNNNLCTIHTTKPSICKEYGVGTFIKCPRRKNGPN